MSITTDPNDPRLSRGGDTEPTKQNEVYLVLSDEERAKGFVRPVRHTYVHVGQKPNQHALRDLTDDERERYKEFGYVKYEEYPATRPNGSVGRFWTAEDLKSGCDVATTMGQALAETWARNIHFYGFTWCCGCNRHLPVHEFVWDGTDEVLGSELLTQ